MVFVKVWVLRNRSLSGFWLLVLLFIYRLQVKQACLKAQPSCN